ncbi:hypothetical protein IWX65_000865 [Arthrobacter sp. CAN_A214]
MAIGILVLLLFNGQNGLVNEVLGFLGQRHFVEGIATTGNKG